MTLSKLRTEVQRKRNSKKAKLLQGFFKTGKGEYGDGDIFLGIMVPESRKLARKYNSLSFPDIEKLLKSKFHEERLIALLILVHNFAAGDQRERKKIYEFYIRSTKYINNWDLVDLSAHKIVGEYLKNKNKRILYKLAKSKNIWERRIAIISTFRFITANSFDDSFNIAEILLKDKHDLIHKAVGWMLREVGNRSLEKEEQFLKEHYKKMPRTMLRYAIEKFPEPLRKKYLKGSI